MESAEYWNQFRKVYLTISAKASDSDFSLYGMLCLAQRAFTCGWILYKLWRGIVGNKLQTNQIVATYRVQASAPVITSEVRHFHSASAVVFSRLHTSRVIYFFRFISPSPEFQQPSYPLQKFDSHLWISYQSEIPPLPPVKNPWCTLSSQIRL